MKSLYHNLMKLCETNDAFFYQDNVSIGGGLYRIFNYNLASYSDFLLTDAMYARGIMFELDKEKFEPIKISALPPNKFFNAYENPMVIFESDYLASNIELIMDKIDGSLISTFMDNDGCIRTKSKGSLVSPHAINANKLLDDNDNLYNEIVHLTYLGWTVNFEYVSPQYRIVLPYTSDDLICLNIRHTQSKEYMSWDKIKSDYPTIYSNSVGIKAKLTSNILYDFSLTINKVKPTFKEFVDYVKTQKGVEGYVVTLKDGTWVKIKTDWYCALHHTKDSINSEARLFEVCLTGGSDDIRQLFENSPDDIILIDKMEKIVFNCYNKIIKETKEFFLKYHKLDKKEYAMKVKECLDPSIGRHGIAFCLYNSKQVDYDMNLLKHVKYILDNRELFNSDEV